MNAEIMLANKLKILNQNILAVVRGDERGLLLVGDPALGKTYTVGEHVDLEVTVYAPSHSSSLGFYEFVYRNAARLVVIDDSADGFRDSKILAFIKAMLWPNPVTKRHTLSWQSTAKILETRRLPEAFDFEGKVIFIANELPKNAHTRAIESRMLVHHFDLSFEERKVHIANVAKQSGILGLNRREVDEILAFIIEHVNPSCRTFDLRLIPKAANLYKQFPGDWQLAVGNLIDADPRYQVLKSLSASGLSVDEQVAAFERETGIKRRQFFKLRDKWELRLH